MLPATRAAARLVLKNNFVQCLRAVPVAFTHHDHGNMQQSGVDRMQEFRTLVGSKMVKADPEELVPQMEVMENIYFDNIHDIDLIKAKAEHLTSAQLKELLQRELDHSAQKKKGKLEKSMKKKLEKPDPEEFVPRKEIADNKYFDDIHDTGKMQMKADHTVNVSLEEILREELMARQSRKLPDPDPVEFAAQKVVQTEKYFDDCHNVDEAKIRAEHLDEQVEKAMREGKDKTSRKDATPAEEADEEERARKAHCVEFTGEAYPEREWLCDVSGKANPFMSEQKTESRPRK